MDAPFPRQPVPIASFEKPMWGLVCSALQEIDKTERIRQIFDNVVCADKIDEKSLNRLSPDLQRQFKELRVLYQKSDVKLQFKNLFIEKLQVFDRSILFYEENPSTNDVKQKKRNVLPVVESEETEPIEKPKSQKKQFDLAPDTSKDEFFARQVAEAEQYSEENKRRLQIEEDAKLASQMQALSLNDRRRVRDNFHFYPHSVWPVLGASLGVPLYPLNPFAKRKAARVESNPMGLNNYSEPMLTLFENKNVFVDSATTNKRIYCSKNNTILINEHCREILINQPFKATIRILRSDIRIIDAKECTIDILGGRVVIEGIRNSNLHVSEGAAVLVQGSDSNNISKSDDSYIHYE